jgi:SPP1 family predicted phage head-tail adaptor
MRAGRLRHWLTFEKQETELDSDGAQVTVWVDAFPFNPRLPCEVVDLSGRELIAAQAVQSLVTTRIRTRYRPGFEASMRARDGYSGRIWNIEAVILDPDSRNRWVTFNCTTGVNEG